MAFEKREVAGEVESANADGIKISGEWFNKGKFYKGPDPLPARGSRVVVEVSGKYINKLSVIGSAREGGTSAAAPSQGGSTGGGYNPDSQRLSIHRQVALKEAGENLRHALKAGTAAVDIEDVLATAARIELWLNRPFGAAPSTAAPVVPTMADDEDESDED